MAEGVYPGTRQRDREPRQLPGAPRWKLPPDMADTGSYWTNNECLSKTPLHLYTVYKLYCILHHYVSTGNQQTPQFSKTSLNVVDIRPKARLASVAISCSMRENAFVSFCQIRSLHDQNSFSDVVIDLNHAQKLRDDLKYSTLVSTPD